MSDYVNTSVQSKRQTNPTGIVNTGFVSDKLGAENIAVKVDFDYNDVAVYKKNDRIKLISTPFETVFLAKISH